LRARTFAWLIVFSLLAAPTGADETASLAQARAAFAEGAARVGRADWAGALAAFERSAALRPHPVTTFNLGACERALGHYTRARP
jgi:hypothetical protein